jgi:hypothetical protein
MRKALWLGAASLLIGMTTLTLVAQNRDASEGMRDRFVGAWRLAWLEEEGADGKIRRVGCTGLLVYTRDGAHVGPSDVSQSAVRRAGGD